MKLIYLTSLFITLLTSGSASCANSRQDSIKKTIYVTLDLNQQYQTIDNFGASDAWSCQFVGNWPDLKKNAIADLLFSTKLKADGSPEGIGLSLWRFNIGGGSAQQGDQSGIKDEWRRAESFLDQQGNYNWSRQAGQLWFLQAAQERGVKQFLGFANSPPVQMTITRKAYASAAQPNLSPQKFDAFADYLSTVAKGIKEKTGILFDYISPVNEPQWDWSDGGQEGSPFTNTDIAGIVKALDVSLKTNQINSKIVVSEAGQYDFLYNENGKKNKGNQIEAFFDPASANHIGNLSSVEKLICGHSYFTTSPFAKAVSVRKQLAAALSPVKDLRFWQSEYCILGDNKNEMNGSGRDLGISPALYLARVIHNDLVIANASAWQWWLAISPYNYKDGLIYIDKNKHDGNYYPSKMLWTLGNYSRFISPGSIRIAVRANTPEPQTLISSYKTEANKLVTVVINSDTRSAEIAFNLKGRKLKNLLSYTTSANKELSAKQLNGAEERITVEPQSITTILSDFE